MDIEEAEEMRELLSVRAPSKAHRDAMIGREVGEMRRLANNLHHQIDAVPACLPLDGHIAQALREIRTICDAILWADDRSAERAA
jgi:hypothetical protein